MKNIWTCFVLMWNLKSDLILNLKTHEWQCEFCEKNFTFMKYLKCHTKFPMSRNHMTLLRLSPGNVFLTKFTLNPVQHIRPWFSHHLNHFPSYAINACDSHKGLVMEAFVTRNAGTNYGWVFCCICNAQ